MTTFPKKSAKIVRSNVKSRFNARELGQELQEQRVRLPPELPAFGNIYKHTVGGCSIGVTTSQRYRSADELHTRRCATTRRPRQGSFALRGGLQRPREFGREVNAQFVTGNVGCTCDRVLARFVSCASGPTDCRMANRVTPTTEILCGPDTIAWNPYFGAKRLDPASHRGRASAVREVGALSDLDDISVRIADVAARLAVLGDRRSDELRSSTFP